MEYDPGSCPNGYLADNDSGWGVIAGASAERALITVGAHLGTPQDPEPLNFGYHQEGNTTRDAGVYLPQLEGVSEAEEWDISVNWRVASLVAADVDRVRIRVDWYSTPAGDNSGFEGHDDGPWHRGWAGAGIAWQRCEARFTAPEDAIRANVTVQLDAASPDNSWALTAARYALVEG